MFRCVARGREFTELLQKFIRNIRMLPNLPYWLMRSWDWQRLNWRMSMLLLFLPDQDLIPVCVLARRLQKDFVMLLAIPLIAIGTLELLAAQVSKVNINRALLCPMIDARRMEVYCQIIRCKQMTLFSQWKQSNRWEKFWRLSEY